MRWCENTSTKGRELERFFDNDPMNSLLALSLLMIEEAAQYRLLDGVVRVLVRLVCGVAPIDVFCFFLGVVGATSSSPAFSSTY